MSILITSPSSITGAPDTSQLCGVLAQASTNGIPVVVASNKPKPHWFDGAFAGSQVQFKMEVGRQNGNIIKTTAATWGLKPHDVLVLAASDDDMRMAKAGGAVLIAAQWSQKQKICNLGIRVTSAGELATVLELNQRWGSGWVSVVKDDLYQVAALADLSTRGKDYAATTFAKELTHTVKQGGAKLNSLLAITSRSLMTNGWDQAKALAWGIYPASSSANDDTDTLSDFGHRLRTTVSKFHFAERGQPLLIRHKVSAKRSRGDGGDRRDPSDQIRTLHLNPHYKGKLDGRHIILLDDCTTYGLSFGVAAALLRAAGADYMTGIALGKFGHCIQYYDIEIKDTPFAPISNFELRSVRGFSNEQNNLAIQGDLRDLI